MRTRWAFCFILILGLIGCGGLPDGLSPATHVEHVVIVVLPGQNTAELMGSPDMPYLDALATRYQAVRGGFLHGQQQVARYMTIAAGDTSAPLPSGSRNMSNLMDSIAAAGKSWKAYLQSLPAVGYMGASEYPYTRLENPLASIPTSNFVSSQAANLVPLTQWANDLAAQQLPAVAYVAPDEQHNTDGCPTEVLSCGESEKRQAADAWLQGVVSPLLQDPQFQNSGVLIVAFENSFSAVAAASTDAIVVRSGGSASVQSSVQPRNATLAQFVDNELGIGTVAQPTTAGTPTLSGLTGSNICDDCGSNSQVPMPRSVTAPQGWTDASSIQGIYVNPPTRAGTKMTFDGTTMVWKNEPHVNAEDFAGADCGARIDSADAALGSRPGEIWVTPACGTAQWSNVVLGRNHILRFAQPATYLIASIVATDGAGIVGSGVAATILQSNVNNDCAITLGHAAPTGSESYGQHARDFLLNVTGLEGVKALCVKEAGNTDITNVYAQVITLGASRNSDIGLYDDGSGSNGVGYGNNWNVYDNVTLRYFNKGYVATTANDGSSRCVSDTEMRNVNILNNRTDGTKDGTTGIYIPGSTCFGIKMMGGSVHGYDIGADVYGRGTLFDGVLWEIGDAQTATVRLNRGASGNVIANSPDMSLLSGVVDNSGNLTNQWYGNFRNNHTPMPNQFVSTTFAGDISFDSSADRNVYINQTDTGTKDLYLQAGSISSNYGGGVIMRGNASAANGGGVTVGLSGAASKFVVDTRGDGNGRDVFAVNNSGDLDASGRVKAGSFFGAGTGLTGTAEQLSIGGNAATATKLSGGGSANHAVCWKDSQTLGYCSTQPDAAGMCKCN